MDRLEAALCGHRTRRRDGGATDGLCGAKRGAFCAGIFVLGLICALLGIGRNAFRYAGITLAIVMLVGRAEPAWMIGIHRFLEISVGIVVGLLLTAVWPETEPEAA